MSAFDAVEAVMTGMLVADDVALLRKRRIGAAILMVALQVGSS